MSRQSNCSDAAMRIVLEWLYCGSLIATKVSSAFAVEADGRYFLVTNYHVLEKLRESWAKDEVEGIEVTARRLRAMRNKFNFEECLCLDSFRVPEDVNIDLALVPLEGEPPGAIPLDRIMPGDQLDALPTGTDLRIFGYPRAGKETYEEVTLCELEGSLVEPLNTHPMIGEGRVSCCLRTGGDMIVPGYSGAPVFESDGNLVGVGAIKIADLDGGGLAVRSDVVSDLLDAALGEQL